MIDDILKNNHLQFTDLAGIILSDGPGSYTGLRIGASVAKTICYCHHLKLLPISGLLAGALRARHEKPDYDYYIGCSDARRDELYITIIDQQGKLLQEPVLWGISNDLIPYIKGRESARFCLVGEGRTKPEASFFTTKVIQLGIGHEALNLQHGLPYLSDNEIDIDYMTFEPYYMQRPNITQSKKTWFQN